MGYLKTVLTYNLPSEAEVDKAFLESRGITVCLLNANTSRNELGAPFFVQLQVMEEDAENARNLIKQMNPQRFGSSERVGEIDRQIKRAIARFVMIAVPVGVVVGLGAYYLISNPARTQAVYFRRHWVMVDYRLELSLLAGVVASIAAAILDNRRQRKSLNESSRPTRAHGLRG